MGKDRITYFALFSTCDSTNFVNEIDARAKRSSKKAQETYNN